MIAEFDTDNDMGKLTSRVQFRRNREVTDALLGSVVSHFVMTCLVVVFVLFSPFLSIYGFIDEPMEYQLTALQYPLFMLHALLHPLLTLWRHEGLWMESKRFFTCLCVSESSLENDDTVRARVVEPVTAGRAHRQQDRHFEMLNNMWTR